MSEQTNEEFLNDLRSQLLYLFEHDVTSAGKMVEFLEAMIDVKIAIAVDELAAHIEDALGVRS